MGNFHKDMCIKLKHKTRFYLQNFEYYTNQNPYITGMLPFVNQPITAPPVSKLAITSD